MTTATIQTATPAEHIAITQELSAALFGWMDFGRQTIWQHSDGRCVRITRDKRESVETPASYTVERYQAGDAPRNPLA